MTTLQKIVLGIVGLAVLILVVVGLLPHKKVVGDATVSNYPTWYYNGIVIGPANTLVSNLSFGSCNLTGSATIPPATAEYVNCAASPAKVGDAPFFSSQNSTTTAPWIITGASVQSAGVIRATLYNASSATAPAPAGTITGVNYLLLR